MQELAYVNGTISKIEDASVNIEDRGYQFGDSIYEVVRSFNGRLFELRRHLQRLARSAHIIMLHLPHTLEQFEEICEGLYRESGIPDGQLYLQVTRGVAPRAHPFPTEARPTVVMTVRHLPVLPDVASAITTPDYRWRLCCAKTTNLLPNVLAKQKATEQGAFEAVFVDPDLGRLYEATANNVFIVKDKTLITPVADNRILKGITREVTLEIASDLAVPVEERIVLISELNDADEVFLTGTHVGILPVCSIDGRDVASGEPGPVTITLRNAYCELTECLSER